MGIRFDRKRCQEVKIMVQAPGYCEERFHKLCGHQLSLCASQPQKMAHQETDSKYPMSNYKAQFRVAEMLIVKQDKLIENGRITVQKQPRDVGLH